MAPQRAESESRRSSGSGRPATANGESPGGRRPCTTEHRQKPDQSSKQSGQAAGLFHSEVQSLMKITGERRERGVVREPLKELADVGDPERTLEAGANFAQAARKKLKLAPRLFSR